MENENKNVKNNAKSMFIALIVLASVNLLVGIVNVGLMLNNNNGKHGMNKNYMRQEANFDYQNRNSKKFIPNFDSKDSNENDSKNSNRNPKDFSNNFRFNQNGNKSTRTPYGFNNNKPSSDSPSNEKNDSTTRPTPFDFRNKQSQNNQNNSF